MYNTLYKLYGHVNLQWSLTVFGVFWGKYMDALSIFGDYYRMHIVVLFIGASL